MIRVTEQPVTNNILTLTKDKIQYAVMTDNTTINLPTPLGYTEIHLVFNTTSAITITSPNVKWDTIPNLESNKTYEFIFTYINEAIGWLAHVISYS